LEKRRKEQARKQKQQEKEQRRVQREAQRRARPESTSGGDPDLEGMVPGPQPLPRE